MREKDIAGYEGLYKIREDGTVVKKDGKKFRGSVNSHGYCVVSLTKNGIKKDHKIHRLLATAFIPNPMPNDYNCVNHIDGNKLNNSLENLEWCTRGQNVKHAREMLHYDYSEKPVIQRDVDGEFVALWKNISTAAKIMNGAGTHIGAACRGTALTAYGYTWEYADSDYDELDRLIRGAELKRKIRKNELEIKRLMGENEELNTELLSTFAHAQTQNRI